MKSKELYNEIVRVASPEVAYEMFTKFKGRTISLGAYRGEFIELLQKLAGDEAAKTFWEKHYGKQFYVGLKFLSMPIRNDEIVKRFNGRNINDLICEFGLSNTRINQIIKEKRKRLKKDKP